MDPPVKPEDDEGFMRGAIGTPAHSTMNDEPSLSLLRISCKDSSAPLPWFRLKSPAYPRMRGRDIWVDGFHPDRFARLRQDCIRQWRQGDGQLPLLAWAALNGIRSFTAWLAKRLPLSALV